MRRDELITQALDTLPQGLDDTYVRIVQHIENRKPPERDLALRTLMWILYAKRPLRIQELQHALAADRAYQTKTDIDPDPVEVILEACGNLIMVENYIVRPVHYSVQEFFTRPPSEICQGHVQRSLANSCLVHETLACICIKYIQLGKLDAPCRDEGELHHRAIQVELACYATQYFDYHIYEAKSLSMDLLSLVESLLKQEEASLAAVLQIRRVNSNSLFNSIFYHFSSITFPVNASTILFGTRLFEIHTIREQWLGDTIPQYALHQASRTGTLNAVQWLLDSKVQVNEKDEGGITPLYYAAMEGHSAVITLLCERGADINAQGGYYGTVLQAACHRGNLEIVKALLDKNADVNLRGGKYGTALQAE
jgi:hypothetical protein